MPLHPNRPGGLRGPGGTHLGTLQTTLSAILTAIEDLTAAVNLNANQTAELVAAMGTPDDTDCGNTLLASLCSINAALVGPGPTEPAPPVICPGFPATPTEWWYANAYTPYDAGGVPSTYQFYPEWTAHFNPPTVYIEVAQPFPGVPEYTFLAIRSTLNATNICISFNKPGTDYTIHYSRWDVPTWTNLGQQSIAVAATVGTGSESINFDADEAISITISSPTASPIDPAGLELWVTQGAQG